MDHLTNSQLTLSINGETGCFSIHPCTDRFPHIREAQLMLAVWIAGERFRIPLKLDEHTLQHQGGNLLFSRTRQELHCQIDTGIEGLAAEVIFAMEKEQPALLWKVVVSNQRFCPVQVEQIVLLQPCSQSHNSNIEMTCPVEKVRFFVNGWQSWSFAGSSSRQEPAMRSRLGLLQNPMVVDAGLKNTFRHGAVADMFGVLYDAQQQKGCLLGFLSQKEQFGHVALPDWRSPSLLLWANTDNVSLQPDSALQTDWAVAMPVEGQHSESIAPYLDLVAKENKVHYVAQTPAGWCSWYQYYQKINEAIIRDNLIMLKEYHDEFPVELVQIDDGYQKQVGDWLAFRPGFAGGMQPICRQIKDAGFTPGVWLAPFIVHRGSDLFKEHPDWILRKRNGSPVNAGFVWNSLGTALDLTQPQASQYVQQLIHTAVNEWKFPYLKLDFLYAAALQGRYLDSTKTRAQVLREGLQLIRDTAGRQTTLVGCGLPLGSGIGLVDTMRIGPDVSGSWNPKIFNVGFLFKKEPSMPSASTSMRNILTRAALHERWWVNDPDCLLVRDQSELSLDEVESLATVIAMSGGSLIFSDDLTALSRERFEMAARLLPPISSRLVVLDWLEHQIPYLLRVDLQGVCGAWHLLAILNWKDHPVKQDLTCRSFGIAAGEYWISSFWQQHITRSTHLTSLGEFEIAPHGCKLLAVRPVKEGEVQYLGSDVHFSQGWEVKKWNARRSETRFTLDAGRRTSSNIYLAIPDRSVDLEVSRDIVNFEKIQEGIYALQIDLDTVVNVLIKNKKE